MVVLTLTKVIRLEKNTCALSSRSISHSYFIVFDGASVVGVETNYNRRDATIVCGFLKSKRQISLLMLL